MTESVVEKPGLEATVIGLLRTVNGTMRGFIGIANPIVWLPSGEAPVGTDISP